MSASTGSRAWAQRLLGVGPRATVDQIKRAYRRLAKKHHPDVGGDAEAFKQLQSAYTLLCKPGRERSRDQARSSGSVENDTPIEIGHWFTVRMLHLDGCAVLGARAQLVVVEQEILIAVYLSEPWSGGAGEVLIYLSESSDDLEIAHYQRPILQRSSDKGKLTALWFSPFDKRMRIDGYEVGKEPVEVEPNPAFRREPKSWWP